MQALHLSIAIRRFVSYQRVHMRQRNANGICPAQACYGALAAALALAACIFLCRIAPIIHTEPDLEVVFYDVKEVHIII